MSNEPENPDMFPLDEAAISVLSDIREQMRPLELQWQGALVLFIRQHKLKGNWVVHQNGKELVRVAEPAPAPPNLTITESKP